MANICSNYVIFTGDEEDLEALQDAIRADDLEGILPLTFEPTAYYNIYTFEQEGDTYRIEFTSPWRCPIDGLEKLCKEFRLGAEIIYEESGMQLYGKYYISRASGLTTGQEMTEEEYLEDQYPDYAVCKKDLLEEPYESFLETYREGFPCEEVEGGDPRYSNLEKYIVNRIKDEDLPLFLNTEWGSSEARDLYLSRIKQPVS